MSIPENQECRFENMILEHLPMFRSLSRRILNNPVEVDDAVQSALLKAWQRRRSFRGEAQLASWVARIVINESYDLLRRQQKEKLVEFTDTDLPATESTREQELQRLDRAIAELPELYRQTVHIAILAGYDTTTAAAMLDCSPNTLYQRIHKAKELLYEALQNDYSEN
ncbi:MAG: RNA polymerase sigma factor [Lentisphaerae bacterium]|jgi:RNA polymerase sigma-70 factor (ECF subfamily)|nr:RNA polymerase sigma factor [Lentisphaerota bacterium]